jgi:hypothetical protein
MTDEYYPIDTDRPVREKSTPPHVQLKMPLERMNVGDSFCVDGIMEAQRARNIASRYGRSTGKHFASRVTSMNTLRVWRIA